MKQTGQMPKNIRVMPEKDNDGILTQLLRYPIGAHNSCNYNKHAGQVAIALPYFLRFFCVLSFVYSSNDHAVQCALKKSVYNKTLLLETELSARYFEMGGEHTENQ